jgi:prevent-host-death family protein
MEVVMATVSAAEFNQRPSQVKRAAEQEPVVITEHSHPSFVLLTYAEYQQLLRAPAIWPGGSRWTRISSSRPSRSVWTSAPRTSDVPAGHQCRQ